MSVTTLTLNGTELRLDFHRWMSFFALKRSLIIPREQIVSASLLRDASNPWPEGLRVGGGAWPGKLAAGRFWRFWGDQRVKSFWAVYDPNQSIRIDLRDHRYDYVAFQVDEPEVDLARLQAWIDG